MKNSVSRNYKKIVIGGLVLAIMAISVGYAALSTNLKIDGSATAKSNSWNIHFDNLTLDDNNTITGTQSITSDTSLSFNATLSKPGDYYGLTVDVVNEGSIDAMINTISKTTLTEEQSKYLDLQITYSDGNEISEKDKLVASGKENILISLSYKDDVDASDLPATDTPVTVNFSMNYVQADSTSTEVNHDSLLQFIAKAKAGEVTEDDLGKTFTIDMGTFGTHTLRVANTTTPSECSIEGFSQTACGVVLEFADIIVINEMNSDAKNIGGWTSSPIYSIVNKDIYKTLPIAIRNNIISTTIVSGYGSDDNGKFTSINDKLYLLDTKEVWGDDSMIESRNSAISFERQLDYYANLEVTTSKNYGYAIKKYNGGATIWWLRSANSNNNSTYFLVNFNGDWLDYVSNSILGISPAFRIA